MTDPPKPRPPSGPRSLTAGPDAGPEAPFPIRLSGRVIKGFGRGSKEVTSPFPSIPPYSLVLKLRHHTDARRPNSQLGIPTANIPTETLEASGHGGLQSGVYFGWVGLEYPPPTSSADSSTSSDAAPTPSPYAVTHSVASGPASTYPAVLSLGYNLFYGNSVRSLEVHVLAAFPADFYGARLKVCVLGFVRPEYDYDGVEALVKDIWTDVDVAARSLAREGYKGYRGEGWLVEWGDVPEVKGDGKGGGGGEGER